MRLLVVLLAAGFCQAESLCPWFNAATAGGILGSAVTASVKPGVCEFSGGKATLRIEVRKKPKSLSASCPARSTPLKAIGNEAVACSVRDSEMVIGRVRDQRFLVSIEPGDAGAAERVRKVAEQVAGNLF